MLTDPELRDELDRVAAAVGVRVVHAGGRNPVGRKTWSAAAAVVLDQAAAERCGQTALPRRAHVSVLTSAEADVATWAAAVAVGAEHVLRMPQQEHELVRELAEAAESARDDRQPRRCRRRHRRLRRCRGLAVRGRLGADRRRGAAAWISIRGVAASICWWAARPHPGCGGLTWCCRADG